MTIIGFMLALGVGANIGIIVAAFLFSVRSETSLTSVEVLEPVQPKADADATFVADASQGHPSTRSVHRAA